MPKIPLYERQVERSAEGPLSHALAGERSSPMTIPGKRAEFAGMQAFAERVTRVGERLVEAEKVEQRSHAMVAANDGLARIMAEINDDPALAEASVEDHEKRFQERAAALKGDLSGRLRHTDTKSAFGVWFDEKSLDGRVKARALGRDRMVSRGRATTDAQLDSLVNAFIRTGDPSALAEGGSILAAKRAAGFFSAAEAEQLGQKFSRQATVGYWERRILDAPGLAYEVLRNQPESLHGLPEDDRTRLIEKAASAAKAYHKDAAVSSAYQALYARHGDNYERALSELNNPAKWAGLGIDYDAAKELNGRMLSLLTNREREERLIEEELGKRREANTRNALVDFYSKNPVDLERIDALARRGEIDRSVYEHIRKGDAEGAAKNDPFALAPIMRALELGEDVTGRLQDAMRDGKIKAETYVDVVKQQADRDYKEGLSLVNKTMQPSDMDFNYDKRHAWGEAVDLYNLNVRNGYHPRVAASMTLERYRKAQQRSLAGLPRPKYLEGDAINPPAVDRAIAATVERFKRGGMPPEEYRFEMENLERVRAVVSRAAQMSKGSSEDEAVLRQIEATKKATR